MATHSRTLAWKIPWMEEPSRLQSMGSQRVRHDWATSLSLFTFMNWRRKWQPTSCLENPRDGGAWWAAVYGVTQSWTWLKWLSSSSSIVIHTLKVLGIVNKADIDFFFWNSLPFLMIQGMLTIWSLVPLPFLKLAWTSGSSWFTYCWSLA